MDDIHFLKDFIILNSTDTIHITGVSINNATCFNLIDCYLIQLKSCVSLTIQSFNLTNSNEISCMDYYSTTMDDYRPSMIKLEVLSLVNVTTPHSPLIRILLPAQVNISLSFDSINIISFVLFLFFI